MNFWKNCRGQIEITITFFSENKRTKEPWVAISNSDFNETLYTLDSVNRNKNRINFKKYYL